METIRELYKVGPGPSSSHTLAPYRACMEYRNTYDDIDSVTVELYGSLSLTGKGHYTDGIIKQCFKGIKTKVVFKKNWDESFPNGFYILGKKGDDIIKWTVFSVGGGSYRVLEKKAKTKNAYKETCFSEILDVCRKKGCSLADYVYANEDKHIKKYLEVILKYMINSVDEGLSRTGVLNKELNIKRSAKKLHEKALKENDPELKNKLRLMSYAYAAGEQNASRQLVVTSPTLGSCGVMASLFYYLYHDLWVDEKTLIDALAVASVFGNIVKRNATISGAVGGCQAEIGVACSMAAAAYAFVCGLDNEGIEYAAEIAMEHHLGLTCDPVGGLVIIPCIERNAVAVLRAIDASVLSQYKQSISKNVVDFDTIVKTMKETGKKIPMELKETSLGGLATEVKKKRKN